MTYTYNGDPSSSTVDAIRLLINDTDVSGESDTAKFADEELLWFYAQFDNDPYYAAAAAADQIAARYAHQVAYSADGVSISFGDLQDKYNALAAALRAQSKYFRRYGIPYAGGISQADVDAVNADDDRVPLSFGKGMHDNPEAGQQDYPNEPDIQRKNIDPWW